MNTATIYITQTGDMINLGIPPEVTLTEYASISREWIRRVEVELPDEFEICLTQDADIPGLFLGDDYYYMTVNVKGDPVIIDHTNNGKYIQLKVISEGWD